MTDLAQTEHASDHNRNISDLTQNQLTELQIFAAISLVGATKHLVANGELYDPDVLHFLDRYNTFANELRARRGQP